MQAAVRSRLPLLLSRRAVALSTSRLSSSSLSSSSLLSRSMFTHFTEEERLEQEDLILHDQSSNSLTPPPPSTLPTSSISAPLTLPAPTSAPSPISALHDSAEARTQQRLHTAHIRPDSVTHPPPPPRVYAKQMQH